MYQSKDIIRDLHESPIPQYYNKSADAYEPQEGLNGGIYTVSFGRNEPIKTDKAHYDGGVADPSTILTLATTAIASSTLQATTYNVAIDFITPNGRTTMGSSQASIAVGAAGENITTSVALPASATGMGVYVWATGSATLLGTISNSGSITYSGGLTGGLAVTVNGTTLNVTITAPSSGTGSAPQASNTTYVPAGSVRTITVPLPAILQKDAKYLVSVSNPASLDSPMSVSFLNGLNFGGTTPIYSSVNNFNVSSGYTQSVIVEGWLLGDVDAEIQVSNQAALGTNSGDVLVDIRAI